MNSRIPKFEYSCIAKFFGPERNFRYKVGLHGNNNNRNSSVGIALGYGLDDRGFGVIFPAGAGNFSLNQRVKNGSGAHPASYPMGTRGSFPGGKASGS
jgi:hypothetical protein